MLGYTQSVPASQPHYVSKAKASLTFFEAGDTIDSGRYTIRYKIGTGAFGTVYHAVDRVGRSFAIKTLLPEEPLPAATEGKRSARKIPRRTLVQRFSEEATAHATVTGHPSIVRLHRTFMALGRCYFVFDLHGGGTLLNAITEQGLYWNDDEAITSAFTQLIDAVAHCHRRGVAHRDLKPDNILISSDGRSYYLADFGLATMDRQCDQFGAGSKHYKSPECIGTEFVGDTYGTHAADVWSLGIILINMITGGHPWNRAHTSDPNFAAYIFERSHLSNVLPLSPRAAILLSRILDPDVRTRITLPELKVEARRVVRWGLDDAELACASDAARASVLSYARTLNMPYVLPPAVRVEPRKFAPSARRTHAVPSAMERQNAFLPPQTSVFDTESIMRPSSSTITVDSQSPATSIMVELPEPPSTPKRDSGKRGSVFRSLRKLKAWAW